MPQPATDISSGTETEPFKHNQVTEAVAYTLFEPRMDSDAHQGQRRRTN